MENFRDARNDTSHALVFVRIPEFLLEVRYLYDQLLKPLMKVEMLILSPQELSLVQKILQRHVPKYSVWAFGSG